MMFKKSREDMLREIENRAAQATYDNFRNMNLQVDMNSVAYNFQRAIAKAVAEGFKVMLENQYTDEQFESDLGLKL